jgi:uncharacterized protein (DUF1778 family)
MNSISRAENAQKRREPLAELSFDAPPHVKDAIVYAAALSGQSVRKFVVSAAHDAAIEAIRTNEDRF